MNEKALQALERMSSDNGYDYTKEDFKNDYNLVETTLKANEIIKEKRVNVAYFIYLFENLQMEDKKALKEYNYSAGSKWAITMEELVILKEVLLWLWYQQ